MSTMARAMLRAGVKLKYSEGFNPHPYMSVALPLQVGCASVCELMDFAAADCLLPDGVPELINAALPEGLEILEAYIPERSFSEVRWIGIEGTLYFDTGETQHTTVLLANLFAAENLMIPKKTKRSMTEIDIIACLRDISFKEGPEYGTILMAAKVSAQNPAIGPANIISALESGDKALCPDFASFTRTETYGGDMETFR